MVENKNIARKLVEVMKECSHISKNGLNDYHNYKYATAGDVLEKVNASLTKHKIVSIVCPTIESMLEVTNKNNNQEHLATISVHVHLVDSDSGESVDLFGIGSGQDSGDKAVMKAQTAAIKYAFMLSLCIATGDDPEADTGTDEVTSEKVNPARPPKATSNTKTCADCGTIIADARVISFSNNRYGRVLCRDCQKLANKAA